MLLESISAFHGELSLNPIVQMDNESSLALEESIIQSLETKSQSSSIFVWIVLALLGAIAAFMLFHAFSIEPVDPINAANWLNNVKSMPTYFTEVSSPLMDLEYKLNWSFYIILTVPAILFASDSLVNQYIKINSMKTA